MTMIPTKIKEIIQQKKARQKVLQERKTTVEKLEKAIHSSKLAQSFKNLYYSTKHFLLLLVTVISVLAAIVIFINPNLLFFDTVSLKEKIITDFKDSYYEITETTLENGLNNVVITNTLASKNTFLREIDQSLEKTATDDLNVAIRFVAILLFLLGLLFLYLIRLNKKLKIRNNLLYEANTLSKNILKDYSATLEEETKELETLTKVVNQVKSEENKEEPKSEI